MWLLAIMLISTSPSVVPHPLCLPDDKLASLMILYTTPFVSPLPTMKSQPYSISVLNIFKTSKGSKVKQTQKAWNDWKRLWRIEKKHTRSVDLELEIWSKENTKVSWRSTPTGMVPSSFVMLQTRILTNLWPGTGTFSSIFTMENEWRTSSALLPFHSGPSSVVHIGWFAAEGRRNTKTSTRTLDSNQSQHTLENYHSLFGITGSWFSRPGRCQLEYLATDTLWLPINKVTHNSHDQSLLTIHLCWLIHFLPTIRLRSFAGAKVLTRGWCCTFNYDIGLPLFTSNAVPYLAFTRTFLISPLTTFWLNSRLNDSFLWLVLWFKTLIKSVQL